MNSIVKKLFCGPMFKVCFLLCFVTCLNDVHAKSAVEQMILDSELNINPVEEGTIGPELEIYLDDNNLKAVGIVEIEKSDKDILTLALLGASPFVFITIGSTAGLIYALVVVSRFGINEQLSKRYPEYNEVSPGRKNRGIVVSEDLPHVLISKAVRRAIEK